MKAANTIAIVVGVGVLGVGVLAGPAKAERWRQAVTDPAYPHITVESELYASETISAPVRSGPRGDEVRLPGGTWVPCGFNCDFTLRNATTYFLSKKGILMLRSASRCASRSMGLILQDSRVMVRCPAVLRGSGFALAPQDDGRASNHVPSSG